MHFQDVYLVPAAIVMVVVLALSVGRKYNNAPSTRPHGSYKVSRTSLDL